MTCELIPRSSVTKIKFKNITKVDAYYSATAQTEIHRFPMGTTQFQLSIHRSDTKSINNCQMSRNNNCTKQQADEEKTSTE